MDHQALAKQLGYGRLAVGALMLATRPGVGRRTVQALAVCDVIDLLVTVGARRALPATGVALIGIMASTGAVAGTVAAQGLPE